MEGLGTVAAAATQAAMNLGCKPDPTHSSSSAEEATPLFPTAVHGDASADHHHHHVHEGGDHFLASNPAHAVHERLGSALFNAGDEAPKRVKNANPRDPTRYGDWQYGGRATDF